MSPDWGEQFITKIDVNVNNNGYYNIYQDNAIWSVVWFNSSNVFSSIGNYNLKVKVWDEMYIQYIREAHHFRQEQNWEKRDGSLEHFCFGTSSALP